MFLNNFTLFFIEFQFGFTQFFLQFAKNIIAIFDGHLKLLGFNGLIIKFILSGLIFLLKLSNLKSKIVHKIIIFKKFLFEGFIIIILTDE